VVYRQSERVVSDALDYRGPAIDSLAAGNGQFLHAGRIDSHIAGGGDNRGAGAHHPGSKPSGVTRQRQRMLVTVAP